MSFSTFFQDVTVFFGTSQAGQHTMDRTQLQNTLQSEMK